MSCQDGYYIILLALSTVLGINNNNNILQELLFDTTQEQKLVLVINCSTCVVKWDRPKSRILFHICTWFHQMI